jgi:hypothetical protein
VNFASQTLWESGLKGGAKSFRGDQGKPPGPQFVRDVSNLSSLCAEGHCHAYEVVLGCHMLEHLANPSQAVLEVKSLLKPRGRMLLVLPYEKACFDRFRDYSQFADIEQHFKDKVDERTFRMQVEALDGMGVDTLCCAR